MADSWEEEADDLTSGHPAAALIAPGTDKWEGEDADEVPDAWDAEPPAAAPAEAEKKPPSQASAAAASAKAKKGKKGLAEACDRKKTEELRRQAAGASAAEIDLVGGEGVAAAASSSGISKEDLRRMQEESDLLITKETFGVNESPAAAAAPATADPEKSIDLMQPANKEEFDRLGRLLTQKLRGLQTSAHYPGFVESLYRECALELDSECLRRLSTMFTALATEKQKMEKEKAGKGGGKAKKVKGSLKVERGPAGAALGGEDYDNQYDDYDEFM